MIHETLTIAFLWGLLLSMGLCAASSLSLRYGNRYMEIASVGWGQFIWGNARSYSGPIGVDVMEGMKWQWEGFSGFWTDWWPRIFLRQRPRYVGIPLWIPAAGFAVLFAQAYLPSHRRHKRMKLGQCIECGYKLTGLTEPRSPDCGTGFRAGDETCLLYAVSTACLRPLWYFCLLP